LMPWASVFDNVWLPLRLQGVARAQAQPAVRQVLVRVGLGEFEHAYPAELSGGMKMRASIARALVTRPPLLLMDEPFAALDEITRQRLNTDLLAWWQQGQLAALFVTHSVFEAVFLSQRVLVMGARPGRIVAELRIDEPYPRTAAFRTSLAYARHCQALTLALETAHATEAAAP
jgi:NitT/TauT family transport system ATP-binding protein